MIAQDKRTKDLMTLLKIDSIFFNLDRKMCHCQAILTDYPDDEEIQKIGKSIVDSINKERGL